MKLDWLSKNYFLPRYNYKKQFYNAINSWGADMLGWTQRNRQQESNTVQIGYEQYLKNANQRALDGWNRTYGRKGLTIKYPEFSYEGQIRRADTAITRNLIDYANADTNYWSNLPYRAVGLYNVPGGFSRYL